MCESKSLYSIAVMRIVIGFMALWAFLDKLLGLGYATPAGRGWLDGTSPTYYYLAKIAHGPLAGVWQTLAGNPLVDWIFMLGLLGVGLSLVFGFWVRLGSLAGIVLFFLLYLTNFPPINNPFFDEHIVYIVALVVTLNCCNEKVLSVENLLKKKPQTVATTK